MGVPHHTHSGGESGPPISVAEALTFPADYGLLEVFVDINQVSSKEDGEKVNPYKTIQAAVDAIAALAENSDDKIYTIMVAPGTYTETLALNNTHLYNLAFIAYGGPDSVIMDPAEGNALESALTNTNLHRLYFKHFRFDGPISLVGATDSTKFLENEGLFEDCTLNLQNGTSLTVTNANRFKWKGGAIHILDTIAIQNVMLFTIMGPNYRDIFELVGAPGETTLVANTGVNMPYHMKDANGGDDMLEYRIDNAFVQRKEPTITATAGKIRVNVRWSYFGLGMGMTFGTNEHLYTYNSIFPGSITCGAGSVCRWRDSICQGTLDTSACTDVTYYAAVPRGASPADALTSRVLRVGSVLGVNGAAYTTIMAAVNAIIAQGTNSDTVGHIIEVEPGTYTETLTLEDDALYNLAFIAVGGPATEGYAAGSGGVIMDPASGDALESEVDNNNLHYLYFKGFRFLGTIHLVGEIHNTLFGEKCLAFEDCGLEGSGSITLTIANLERFAWINGCIGRATVITAQNIWSMSFNGERYSDWPMGMAGMTTLTADTAQNMPYHMDDDNQGGDQMSFSVNHAFCQRNKWTFTTGGDGVLMVKCINGLFSCGSGITMPANGSLYGYTGIFVGNVTMDADGDLFLYNTAITGDLTENGCAKTVYPSAI